MKAIGRMVKKMMKRGSINIQMEEPLRALSGMDTFMAMEKCGSAPAKNTLVNSPKENLMEKANLFTRMIVTTKVSSSTGS